MFKSQFSGWTVDRARISPLSEISNFGLFLFNNLPLGALDIGDSLSVAKNQS